jgi:FHIPEP family
MTAEDGTGPELPVAVEIPDRLVGDLEATPEGTQGAAAMIASTLDELLVDFGVPGRTRVEVVARPEWPFHEWMRLRVDDRPCRYSPELLAQVTAALGGQHAQPARNGSAPDWPVQTVDGQSSPRRLADLLAWLCRESVKLQPSMLLGQNQCLAFAGRLRGGSGLPSALMTKEWLHDVLTGVLGLGISVADVRRIGEVLATLEGDDPTDARELLVAALSTDVVELLVADHLWPQLGTGDLADENDQLAFAAEGMFEETGVVFPALRCVPPDGLPPDYFAFRVNHVLTAPWRCLREDEILVNDSAESLAEFTSAEPIANPATGQLAAIVAASEQETLEARGLTTWTAAGYVILCLAHVLRTRAGCFVHHDKVQAQLDTLETVVPAAVRTARSQLRPSRFTALVRALAADHVPLRHLLVLLERVIDTPYAALGIERLALLDDAVTAMGNSPDRLDDPLALETFVRTGLRQEIADQLTRRQGTLVTYLMDPAIEILLRSPHTDADEDAVLAAIREELQFLPPTARTPAVLTADDLRPLLRDLLARALPRLSVVGYGDLPSDLNVQPVARIKLPIADSQA